MATLYAQQDSPDSHLAATATPEFTLIAKYFTRPTRRAKLGIGDDCALIDVTSGKQLAISTDTLVAGVHFFADADPAQLGHKALAVNLSDLAAMGASPRHFTLAITLPSVDDAWLAAFAGGLFKLATQFDIELIGGDTTKGSLSMTLTVMGQITPGAALQRDRAKAGDDIWVSGSLGGAALALRHLKHEIKLKPNVLPRALARLHTPEPRVALGLRLANIPNTHIAAIDISDGLVADLGHISARSRLGAAIHWPQIPLHPALLSVGPELRMPCALTGGDDYELCFTAPISVRTAIEAIARDMELPLTKIGSMIVGAGVQVHDERGEIINANVMGKGFDHFANVVSGY